MRLRSLRLWLPAVLGASLLARVSAGEGSTDLVAALKNEQHAFETLQRLRTQLGSPYERIKDWRGNSLSDDLLQNVMTPDSAARIQSQLHSAQLALGRLDVVSARSRADEVGEELAAETNMYKGVREYWSKWGSHAPDRSAYWDNLTKNGLQRRYAEQIGAAEANFRQQISARHFLEAMTQDYPALSELYKRAAQEESDDIAAAIESGHFIPLLSRTGPATCSHPNPPTSGSEKPQFYKSGSQHDDPYPVESRRIGESGIAYMYITVSEAGCVTEAIMTASTGYSRLDTAALDFVTRARFKPAENGGHAVASRMTFKFSFTLTE